MILCSPRNTVRRLQTYRSTITQCSGMKRRVLMGQPLWTINCFFLPYMPSCWLCIRIWFPMIEKTVSASGCWKITTIPEQSQSARIHNTARCFRISRVLICQLFIIGCSRCYMILIRQKWIVRYWRMSVVDGSIW